MRGNRQLAARRKLLSILSREELETLSQSSRPHMLTQSELVSLVSEKWDLDEVHACVERIFRRADPEGTSP